MAAETVTLTGRVSVEYREDLRNGRLREWLVMRSGDRYLRLAGARGLVPGDRVEIRGTLLADGRLRVVDVVRLGEPRATAANATIRPRIDLLVLLGYPGRGEPPTTSAATIEANVAEWQRWTTEVANGRTAVSYRVVDWLPIDGEPGTMCSDPQSWMTSLRRAAAVQGVDIDAYTHIAHGLWLVAEDCWWGGLAFGGGRDTAFNIGPAWWQALDTGYLVHEIGHNLDLPHMSRASCVDPAGVRIAWSASCGFADGDPTDPMGGSPRGPDGQLNHNTAHHRLRAGLLTAAETRTIRADATVVLGTAAALGSNPRLLTIDRGDGTAWQVEYRQPFGFHEWFPSGSTLTDGVLVRLTSATDAFDPRLTDGRLATEGFADAALPNGVFFHDLERRITMRITSRSSSAVTLAVTVGDQPPSAPVLSYRRSATSVSLSWTAARDDRRVTGYEVFDNGRRVATLAASKLAASVRVRAGSGIHSFTVVAIDSGGWRTVSNEVVLTF